MHSVLPDGRLHRKAVEYAVVDHCNLSCDECDHGSPLARKKFASLDGFAWSVSRLASVLFVDRLKLLGGEPLLHPDIGEFARLAKQSGIAGEVQIWTNGTLVNKVSASAFKHVDRLVISKYPSIELPICEEEIRDSLAKFECRLSIRKVDEFINCFPKEKIADRTRVLEIFGSCKNTGDWSCHSFQDGHYFKCSRAHYLRKRAYGALPGGLVYGDGVRLDGPDLRGAMVEYLGSKEPLAACEWCLGTSGTAFPHRVIPRKTARELERARSIHS